MHLNKDLAEQILGKTIASPMGLTAPEAAYGIFSIVNSNMATVVREISVGRGLDPRDSCLIVAGGWVQFTGVKLRMN